jgi:endo-1,4-beta-mannosidase
MKYIAAVVERYKNNPALDSYQLENEFFLKVFGICPDFSRDRLVAEYDLVKRLDPHHTLVVSMSNNAIGTPIGEPTPDMWAISVYKRVWDKTLTKRYFEYPIPAWYYAFRAGWVKITRGHNSFIHELQAEAWPAADMAIQDAPLAEQDKSLDAKRLKDRFEYGRATGMRTIDLWGAEWWYWRKAKMNDPSLWNVGKEEYKKANSVQ